LLQIIIYKIKIKATNDTLSQFAYSAYISGSTAATGASGYYRLKLPHLYAPISNRSSRFAAYVKPAFLGNTDTSMYLEPAVDEVSVTNPRSVAGVV